MSVPRRPERATECLETSAAPWKLTCGKPPIMAIRFRARDEPPMAGPGRRRARAKPASETPTRAWKTAAGSGTAAGCPRRRVQWPEPCNSSSPVPIDVPVYSWPVMPPASTTKK